MSLRDTISEIRAHAPSPNLAEWLRALQDAPVTTWAHARPGTGTGRGEPRPAAGKPRPAARRRANKP